MANKTFLRSSGVYEAPNKRLQNDIELVGATITRANGRVTKIEFASGTGGGVGEVTLQSPDGSMWTLTINNDGVLSQTKP